MNADEREPVETRVLNPNASEASYKPKQRIYRKTNLKKKVLAPDGPGAKMSGAEMSSTETAAPNRRRQKVTDPFSQYINITHSYIFIFFMFQINSIFHHMIIVL